MVEQTQDGPINATSVTEGDGTYNQDNVDCPQSNYIITLNTATLPNGYTVDTPNPVINAHILGCGKGTEVDFGIRPTVISQHNPIAGRNLW